MVRSQPNVVKTGLDMAKGDKGNVGKGNVGEGKAHSADTKENAQTLAGNEKLY